MSLLDTPGPVLLVHAHPDDETLATGALVAHLAATGRQVAVLTATRGERGEVVPGSLPPGSSAEQLDAAREVELAAALAVLGVTRSAFLGTPPARVPGLAPRRYLDSGMRWVAPGTAGPAEDADERSLTAASLADVVADLCAFIDQLRPSLVIGYDVDGSYGHPDHVRCHHATVAAAARTGVALLEVVSEVGSTPGEGEDGTEWLDLPEQRPTVLAALAQHRTQLRVLTDVDGRPQVEHVGGQRHEVSTLVGLRPGGTGGR